MEKIWLKRYQAGVPEEIDVTAYRSLVDLWEESCKKFTTQTNYINFGSKLTYAEVDKLALHLAAYLQQIVHLKPGDRVGVMLPNLLQFPVALFAILRAGCVVVNINPLYTAPELAYVLKDSGAKVLIALAHFKPVVQAALADAPVQQVILTEIADLFRWPKRFIMNMVLRHIKRLVPKLKLDNAITFREALDLGEASKFSALKLQHEDGAFLQYTGGTTGTAKAAILTHGNLLANVLQLEAWLKPALPTIDEIQTVITALPLYHIFSLTVNCFFYLTQRAVNVLITNPRDIPRFLKTLKKYPMTAITGVNTLFNALLQQEDFAKLNFSHLRLSIVGGMALQSVVAERWQQVTGCVVIEGYGLTEASPVVCANPLDTSKYNSSVGLPMPSTQISVRNEKGEEVPIGEAGELCVRGPQVMKGYWQSNTLTEVAFTPDGWLRTGDLVRVDANGFIYILDRIKDMIIVSGFNVYPNEIEDVLVQHPGVLEAGVIGVPDAHSGEVVKAFIVKKDPNLTEKDILEFCKTHLTKYKIPKQIEFRDTLPKTNVGKILRRALKAPA